MKRWAAQPGAMYAQTARPATGTQRLHRGQIKSQIRFMRPPALDFSRLSPQQRLELIGELWDSLQDELPPLEDVPHSFARPDSARPSRQPAIR